MSKKLRRGFKAEAERISLRVRSKLGFRPEDRFDCLKLASRLEIPVIPLPELLQDGASTKSIQRLMSADSGFSALTVCVDSRRLIVYNPNHPPGRQANSLAHELSHVLLGHPLKPALGNGGCRYWDDCLEAEADWLAGALLVPREGALRWLLHNGNDLMGGAQHFGVSLALFRWRVYQTGVVRQIKARKRYSRDKSYIGSC